ncbi:dirigent protein 23-like [Vigna unguiculata]|uniref:Dirigent protein n=1 Tax=Vigna unguiculata TaxID=3917 RepID=A0A4D6LIK0_VIGUN|nr:dirigent protein 23-like [Vigna unguiculata]QCD87954.1 Plant disease resistance response protein [Vigna unguiculata]
MASSKFFSFSILLLSTTVLYVTEAEEALPKTMVLYLQETTKGPNATVSPIIGLTGKDWSFNQFGTVFAVDDPVMVSPNPFSSVVGRAQGLLVVSAHDGANVFVSLSIVFTNFQYSGSSIEIQGVSRQREKNRELSVVSGTGKFRFVKGYAAFQTAFYDPQNAHSTISLTLNFQ